MIAFDVYFQFKDITKAIQVLREGLHLSMNDPDLQFLYRITLLLSEYGAPSNITKNSIFNNAKVDTWRETNRNTVLNDECRKILDETIPIFLGGESTLDALLNSSRPKINSYQAFMNLAKAYASILHHFVKSENDVDSGNVIWKKLEEDCIVPTLGEEDNNDSDKANKNNSNKLLPTEQIPRGLTCELACEFLSMLEQDALHEQKLNLKAVVDENKIQRTIETFKLKCQRIYPRCPLFR